MYMVREIINNCRQGKCEKEEKVKDVIIVFRIWIHCSCKKPAVTAVTLY